MDLLTSEARERLIIFGNVRNILSDKALDSEASGGGADPRPPLSARHIEVEQDRAPTVLPHHAGGRPLTDRLDVVELIGATTIKTGLTVESALDMRNYQKGIKISKSRNEMPRYHR